MSLFIIGVYYLGAFFQGPVGILLMTKDDIIEHRFGHAEMDEGGSVDVGALSGDVDHLSIVLDQVNVVVDRLERGGLCLLCRLEEPMNPISSSIDPNKYETGLGHDGRLSRQLGVVDECLSLV